MATRSSRRRQLRRHLKNVGQEFQYVYDFGDNWEHASTLEWCGGAFDPEAFEPGEVVFEDPFERLREVEEGW
ncbi:MAG: hypothetical protein IPP62_18030 [bacterium]|nr:hypothetical protein [bacterium]